jgi:beta-aspartyl-peptidase (threonine type)
MDVRFVETKLPVMLIPGPAVVVSIVKLRTNQGKKTFKLHPKACESVQTWEKFGWSRRSFVMDRKAQVLWLLGIFMLSVTGKAAEESSTKPTWAIAIHGGAGGNLLKLDEEARRAKEAGLKEALEAGRTVLKQGGTALDAVEAVIRIFEDNSTFNAGRGAVMTTDGLVELDASIMDGKTLACGAVACVTNVKNPITLAKRVMTETKHVLLVGKGAEEFAASQKLPLVDPSYFLSHRAISSDSPERLADSASEDSQDSHYGTVGCVALDAQGNLAAGTSTGGTTRKLPGRVGDSPIIGAGNYAANDSCAISGTGIGEEFIRHAVAYDIAAQIRYSGRSIEAAVTEIMQKRLKPDVGGLIALSRNGTIVLQHNTTSMACGAADSTGRFEVYLAAPK